MGAVIIGMSHCTVLVWFRVLCIVLWFIITTDVLPSQISCLQGSSLSEPEERARRKEQEMIPVQG